MCNRSLFIRCRRPQVVNCEDISTGEVVAIKVIKNKPAYYKQALVEIQLLKTVSGTVRFLASFVRRRLLRLLSRNPLRLRMRRD